MSSHDDSDRDRNVPEEAGEARRREAERGVPRADHADEEGTEPHNPPHTTSGKFTAPKFGSAVSGGGDIEPAPGS